MQLTGWPEYVSMIYLPIILVGLVGNGLSLYVYTTPNMRKSTVAFLLYSLSICDIFVLLFALPLYSISYLPIWDNVYGAWSKRRMFLAFSTKFFYPLCMTAKTASLYIMVVITVERWIAVCRPLQVHIWCTFKNSVRIVIAIIAFSIILNLPKFFEYQIGYSDSLGYWPKRGILDAEEHWWYYITYFIFISVIFDYLLPFVIMFVANMKVINELRKSRKERALLTTSLQKEQNTTVMLLVVTILFGFCHFFSMALKLMESLFKDFLTRHNEYFEVMIEISNILIIIHIGTTFFIYYFFSARFRNILSYLFQKRRDLPENSLTDVNKRKLLHKSDSTCTTFAKTSPKTSMA
ncbi:hypothetical protein GCK72_017203 [Caenorhabditis remanei]|uniref:G-protein coupled receptors family 1 profile domain-containing protein n=2 Tax=Caenorhabditis remanei TaxID=31234 RepID=E3N527_CAERE|nr:hypothetical protein GCK72_017203 [Caenorhabditis remanei]EFO87031.1 hypothetical protein CRE_19386 [Caenorhabditis remanei]KAF1750652.1 hypothetical protein GCK72_017203 [Caenorhabditis remanei]